MENLRIPKKLENCPLKEVVLEIRFESNMPSDAIFGVIYSKVSSFFDTTERLPITQLPEDIKENDPGLKYKAHFKLQKDNLSLNIGPRSISFNNLDNYIGWSDFRAFFQKHLDQIMKIDIFDKVERVGLRYINIFYDTILDNLNLEIKMAEDILEKQSVNLNVDFEENEFLKKVKIGNKVGIMTKTGVSRNSIIDIDYIMKIEKSKTFLEDPYSKIEEMHQKEKEYFFGLLKEDFLSKLGPTY